MKCRVPRFRPYEMKGAQVQLRGPLRGLHNGSLVWISKPVVSHNFFFCRGSHVAVGISLLYLNFSLFVSFAVTSAVLCHCFKVMSLDGI